MKKDLVIMFCPKCNWKLVNPEFESEKMNRCPKCDTWTFEVSQEYHYDKKTLIAQEFNLTDNDGNFMNFYSIGDANKVFNKAFRLFRLFKKERKVGVKK